MSSTLELRSIELRVPDHARSVAFYVSTLGFHAVRSSGSITDLATQPEGAPILRLIGDSSAPRPPRDAAGLFHAALLFPNREALGSWLKWADSRRLRFDGFSDHGVSEAIYFHDPDGNGLEFYADRAPTLWPRTGTQVEMTTNPLDIAALLALARPVRQPLEQAHWGHLHLRVTDLDRSERFYTELLGMGVTQRTYPGARFLAADGYHHHLGLNVWGQPSLAMPPNSVGLAAATFGTARVAELRAVTDPDGIRLKLEPLRGSP